MLSSEMFLTWFSTCLTKVQCRPDSKASASWDHPRSALSDLRLWAKISRVERRAYG
jgi:hypothetical protein